MKTSNGRAIVESIVAGRSSADVRRLNPHLFAGSQPTSAAPQSPPAPSKAEKGMDGPSEVKKTRIPNKTEQRFIDMLEARIRRGDFGAGAKLTYEGMRLKWGACKEGCMHYTPDIVLYRSDLRSHVLYETKGAHVRQKDIVRFKGCRAEWPQFEFVMVQWKDGEWTQLY